MPNYDFECLREECGHKFVLNLPMSSIGTAEHDWPTCPKCERIKTRRVIKAPQLCLKAWRKRLAHLPYECDAIEAGCYE